MGIKGINLLCVLAISVTLAACGSSGDRVRNETITPTNIGTIDSDVQSSSLSPNEKAIFHQQVENASVDLYNKTVGDVIGAVEQEQEQAAAAQARTQAAADAVARDNQRRENEISAKLVSVTVGSPDTWGDAEAKIILDLSASADDVSEFKGTLGIVSADDYAVGSFPIDTNSMTAWHALAKGKTERVMVVVENARFGPNDTKGARATLDVQSVALGDGETLVAPPSPAAQ